MTWIRKARIGDIPTVYTLEAQSFKDPYPPLLLMRLLALYPYGFLVAEREGRVIGYIIFRTVGEKGHIISLAVEERLRKRKIGAELLKKAEEILRKMGMAGMWLEVRESNIPAQRFYARQGFKKVGVAEGYYADGEDGLIYYRTLSS
ncbi:MAG: ribosomal-protein-alanine N-acetyltransferase [Methanobacteriota archaeon]|nr:MAG: ribosomal-protein-alanine N-acetyltransferase [Euryarchaeota archaeon]